VEAGTASPRVLKLLDGGGEADAPLAEAAGRMRWVRAWEVTIPATTRASTSSRAHVRA